MATLSPLNPPSSAKLMNKSAAHPTTTMRTSFGAGLANRRVINKVVSTTCMKLGIAVVMSCFCSSVAGSRLAKKLMMSCRSARSCA